ncbi:MAG: hypothetical protein ABS96_03595 [Lysobacteraceae bacterium SCN 69-123]|uniref:DUF3617 domain-containing protein n=1 Tax=Stenotrophomonas acidaminiphila TaxID=128780 RepID=UPI00086C1FEE|nr:DUF3617 family protein [Stenotrophomonas acidaminiphila]MBN8801714.1 DUF3617 family protein [Stenotrophomonas acidaminiphila]ODU47689.1 MAG: hypothetical protein ABS96_03595 [Xanthomonadaceae bacterium SCN 69-123]
MLEDAARAAFARLPGTPLPRPAHLLRLLGALLLLLPCVAAAGPAAKGASPATGSSLPARKPGLWEVTLAAHAAQGPGSAMQPEVTVRQCTSTAVESVMLLALLPAQENCSRTQVTRRTGQGGGHEIATTCSTHQSPVQGRMELWGDLQSVYGGTFSVRFPQAPQNNVGPVRFQGRWLGRCGAGQRAGDMLLPNGITVNVADDAARVQGHAH